MNPARWISVKPEKDIVDDVSVSLPNTSSLLNCILLMVMILDPLILIPSLTNYTRIILKVCLISSGMKVLKQVSLPQFQTLMKGRLLNSVLTVGMGPR